MGIANPSTDPANVVQALVYILAGVFDATKDLYRNLTFKEQREYEQSLRSKGYPASRRVEFVRDERLGSEEAIMTDRKAVVRQFEIGYHAMGTEFAMGDVTAEIELQSQIITLQSVLVTTTIYGPASTDSIAHQLSNINTASRAAAARSIEILAQLQERQMDDRSVSPHSVHSVATVRSPPSQVESHRSSYAPSITPSQSISCARGVTAAVAPPPAPSKAPSQAGSQAPSKALSKAPSKAPSQAPSKAPSQAPSKAPSQTPSKAPSQTPSKAPSQAPSKAPSQAPSKVSSKRSHAPSVAPSHVSSKAPSRVLSIPQPPMGSNSPSVVSVKQEEPTPVRSGSPVKTTILDGQTKSDSSSSSAASTSTTGPPPSSAPTSAPGNLYCPYAYDLQRDPTQALHSGILSTKDPRCPHCTRPLHLSPGKAWEISKWAGDTERTFQVQNRFVVKCHRDGPDGQYCCVICSKYSDADTVCGDVKALVKHLSEEHDVRELKHEEDVVEIIDKVLVMGKRDSGVGYPRGAASIRTRSRSRRRSVSVMSGRGLRRRSIGGLERNVDIFDARAFRR